MKLTQPRKNGGEDIEGELALWWQGDMEPASTMNFLRFSLARVTGLSSAKRTGTAAAAAAAVAADGNGTQWRDLPGMNDVASRAGLRSDKKCCKFLGAENVCF